MAVTKISYNNIVFFDGYCVLCNGFVDFLLKIDKNDKLKFSSLQGNTARNLLGNLSISSPNTVVFINSSDNVYEKSDAVIEILKAVGGFWSAGKIIKTFPKFVRDYIYDLVARNRYNIFGKRTYCRIPSKEEKHKILP